MSINRVGIVLCWVSNVFVFDDVVYNLWGLLLDLFFGVMWDIYDDFVFFYEVFGFKEVSKVFRFVGVNEGKVKGWFGL